MNALYVSLVAVVLAQGAAGAVFEIDLWPGEGRPRLVAAGGTIQPRVEPSSQAATMPSGRVTKGQPIDLGKTLYRTTRAGQLRASATTTIIGRRLGPILRFSRVEYYSGGYATSSVSVAAGERIEYLQDLAEGACFVRVRGDVIEAELCPVEARTGFVLEAQPQTEWWVERLVNGRPQGWLRVDGKTVKESGRTF